MEEHISHSPHHSSHSEKNQANMSVPIAIILAGALIAGAVYFSNKGTGIGPIGNSNPPPPPSANTGQFKDIGEGDFVRGNPNGAITIVEYSDFECPFCQRFHPTMQQVINQNNDIKWVYRHFPLTSIHAQAQPAATAAECAGRVGGNDTFWRYADKLFESQTTLGEPLYEQLAREMNVNIDQFRSCRASTEVTQEITEHSNEAVGNGARGTPFALVIGADGQKLPIGGALPYENVLQIIQQARGQQ